MIKTKREIAEEVRNDDMRGLVIAEINELYFTTQAKAMKRGSKERIEKMQQSNQQSLKQFTETEIIKIIDRKIAQYKNEERKKV
jgi:hypothetical protein